MRKPENTWISSVHKYLPSTEVLHREKMHNAYRGGTPDWWYSGAKHDLWVEYKYMLKLPKREHTVVVPTLSALQLDWCTKRFAQGRFVQVVLGTRDGAILFATPQEWTDGLTVSDCTARMMSRQQLAALINRHCNEGPSLC